MVAEVFGKRHDNVIRDIKSLECSEEFSLLNFEESNYTNERGKTYTKYYITQDGFSFLVMGYNGKEAASFKENYIREFNRMRDELAMKSPANDYLNMSDEDRAIAYFMKVKAEKELLMLAEQNKQLNMKTHIPVEYMGFHIIIFTLLIHELLQISRKYVDEVNSGLKIFFRF